MSISIILIAYYGDRWLPACFGTLGDAIQRPFHLILVDNAGNTIIDNLDLSMLNHEVISTPYPMGFARANNYALVNASHLEDIVLFLNQDTISPDGWIDSCIEILNKYPELGAVSPVIRNYDDDGWDPSFLNCISEEQQESLKAGDLSDDIIYTNNVPAPALLVRTDVLRQVGPFDPIYGSYYEDYDLCRRIRQLGYQVGFCTDARIRHFSGGSTKTPEQERKRLQQIVRNRVIHQLRSSEKYRSFKVIRSFFCDLPIRVFRGIKKTSSSQPPGVTIKAYLQLLKIFFRLISTKIDNLVWEKYLREIDWPAGKVT